MPRKKVFDMPEPFDVPSEGWNKVLEALENNEVKMDTPRYKTDKVFDDLPDDYEVN